MLVKLKLQYAGTSTPSLVSDPYNEEEWSSFWHPLYGVCYAFKTSKPLVEIVGSAGVEYVKVDLNFEQAFPALSTESSEELPETTTTTTTTTTEFIPDTTTEEDDVEITEAEDDSNSTIPEDDEPIFGKKFFSTCDASKICIQGLVDKCQGCSEG
jgi:hypothetical protein